MTVFPPAMVETVVLTLKLLLLVVEGEAIPLLPPIRTVMVALVDQVVVLLTIPQTSVPATHPPQVPPKETMVGSDILTIPMGIITLLAAAAQVQLEPLAR